jgi:dTDP-4-amino-4,6-dideoxygalactose transaminase
MTYTVNDQSRSDQSRSDEKKTSAEKNQRSIPFSPPDISELEIEEVGEALRSGWITTGPRTKELERRLAEYCHTNKVVCLNSATAAEELNFRICGIGEGDEVIVPAYTYTATASAAIHAGAKVVFIDSQPDSVEMDYDAVAVAITEKTKAIVAVDLGGIVADYERLFEVVEEKKSLFRAKEGSSLGARIQQSIGRVLVFADCAHALGASRKGKMAGEIADFTSFSFHAVKNFTTAEGGASTWRSIEGIDDEEMYHQYQLYSLHGQSKDALAKTKLGAWEYDIVGPWYKCNMTDIMAAMGLRQLDRYEGMLKRRREIIGKYDKVCDELGVKHLEHYGEDEESSGHLYITRIPGITVEQRNEIITKMAERGVATNVHYKPLPMMTAYKTLGWDIKDFPNAYELYKNEITLPLHTKLTDEDVEYVCEVFEEVVREYI